MKIFKSLSTEIKNAERQLLVHQQKLDACTVTLLKKVQQKLQQYVATPGTLWLGGGVGFILGEITKQPPKRSSGTASHSRSPEGSPLRRVLNLVSSAHSLYSALPIVWMLKNIYQPGSKSNLSPDDDV
jgi:hypothetical protein